MTEAAEREVAVVQLATFVQQETKRYDGRLGIAALGLACHAALPVAIDTGLLHLLRINFFANAEVTVPYEVEADLLLSPLCTEVGDGLYTIPRAIRAELLERLLADYGNDRMKEVATLLSQYSKRHRPWQKQPRLERAQELTAWSFVDPAAAAAWLTRATEAGANDPRLDQAWLVAMQAELNQRQDQPVDHEVEWGEELQVLCEALSQAFPSFVELALTLDDAAIDRRTLNLFGDVKAAWETALKETMRVRALDALAQSTRALVEESSLLRMLWTSLEQSGFVLRYSSLSPGLEREHAALLGRLREVLVALAPGVYGLAYQLAGDVGLDPAEVEPGSGAARYEWHYLVHAAAAKNKLRPVVTGLRLWVPEVDFSAAMALLEQLGAAPRVVPFPKFEQLLDLPGELRLLRRLLAERCPDPIQLSGIEKTGLKWADVRLGDPPIIMWTSTLNEAIQQGKLRGLIEVVRNNIAAGDDTFVHALQQAVSFAAEDPARAAPLPDDLRQRLLALLVRQYPKPRYAQLVARNFGLIEEAKEFKGSTERVWANVVTKLENDGKQRLLIDFLLREHPGDAEHRELTSSVLAHLQTPPIEKPPQRASAGFVDRTIQPWLDELIETLSQLPFEQQRAVIVRAFKGKDSGQNLELRREIMRRVDRADGEIEVLLPLFDSALELVGSEAVLSSLQRLRKKLRPPASTNGESSPIGTEILPRIEELSRAVALVRSVSGSLGTGFLISGNRLIMPHHLVPDRESAANSVAIFDPEASTESILGPMSHPLVPDEFFATSEQNDWTVVQLAGNPNAARGAFTAIPAQVHDGDRIFLVGYPNGSGPVIRIPPEGVASVGEQSVRYLTERAPGTGGAPVLNRNGEVVAMHLANDEGVGRGIRMDVVFRELPDRTFRQRRQNRLARALTRLVAEAPPGQDVLVSGTEVSLRRSLHNTWRDLSQVVAQLIDGRDRDGMLFLIDAARRGEPPLERWLELLDLRTTLAPSDASGLDLGLLCSVLAGLFESSPKARIIASDVGVSESKVSLHGSTQAVWREILHQAASEQKLYAIVLRALEDYPEHLDLRLAALALVRGS